MRWVMLTLACSCGSPRAQVEVDRPPAPARRTLQVEVRAHAVGLAGGSARLDASAWLWPGSAPSRSSARSGCGLVPTPPRSAQPIPALQVYAGQAMPLAWNRALGRYDGVAHGGALDPSWRDVGVALPVTGPVPVAERRAVHFGGALTGVTVRRAGEELVVEWEPPEPDTRVAVEVAGPAGTVRCGGASGGARLPMRLLEAPGADPVLVSRRASDALLPGGTRLRVEAVWERPLGVPPA